MPLPILHTCARRRRTPEVSQARARVAVDHRRLLCLYWVRQVFFENAFIAFWEVSLFLADCFALEPVASNDWACNFDLILWIRSIKDRVQIVIVRVRSSWLPRAIHAAHFCANIRAGLNPFCLRFLWTVGNRHLSGSANPFARGKVSSSRHEERGHSEESFRSSLMTAEIFPCSQLASENIEQLQNYFWSSAFSDNKICALRPTNISLNFQFSKPDR
jgi:hypothetical protein